MNLPDPGHKRGESKEQGIKRRLKEGNVKTHKLWLEIQREERKKHAEAERLIEERLGGYDDRPL